jgi:transposase
VIDLKESTFSTSGNGRELFNQADRIGGDSE